MRWAAPEVLEAGARRRCRVAICEGTYSPGAGATATTGYALGDGGPGDVGAGGGGGWYGGFGGGGVSDPVLGEEAPGGGGGSGFITASALDALNEAGVRSGNGYATITPLPTVPTAPQSANATAGNAQATVSWDAPADDGGSPIVGFTATCASTSGAASASASDIASPIVVSGLTNGATYTCSVTATNAIGESAASAPSNAVVPRTVPGAPTSVVATPGNGKVTVSWTAPASNGGSAIIFYSITPYHGTIALPARTFWATTTSAVMPALTNGTAYNFKVQARNAAGAGPMSVASNVAIPRTVPGAPTGVTASPGNGHATVSWTAPTATGGAAITGYTITPYIGTVAQTALPYSSKATTQTITATNATTYTFKVTAKNPAGNSQPSVASTAIKIGTPVAPTVSAVASSGQAVVSWPGLPRRTMARRSPGLRRRLSIGAAADRGVYTYVHATVHPASDLDRDRTHQRHDLHLQGRSDQRARKRRAGRNHDHRFGDRHQTRHPDRSHRRGGRCPGNRVMDRTGKRQRNDHRLRGHALHRRSRPSATNVRVDRDEANGDRIDQRNDLHPPHRGQERQKWLLPFRLAQVTPTVAPPNAVRQEFTGSGLPKLQFLGDSITVQSALDINAHYAATYDLSIHAAVGLGTHQTGVGTDASLNPNIEIINLGTNDAAKGVTDAPAMLYAFAAAFPATTCVVFVTINTHNPSWGPTLAQAINDHVRATFPHVADWDAAWDASYFDAPDNPHPNAAGRQALLHAEDAAIATCPTSAADVSPP